MLLLKELFKKRKSKKSKFIINLAIQNMQYLKVLPLLVVFLSFSQAIFAREFTFIIHHFLSPQAILHTKMIEPWTKKITKESKGKIKFEIYPSMSLGGSPKELYGQVKDGVVDIAWTLAGYTPGVFPRVEVFELPSVHQSSAQATNLALQDTFELIKDDFQSVHPLLLHTHAGNALHLVSKDVKKLADLVGLKIRTPSRTGAWLIEAWGAEPVGMPVPVLPQALSKKTIDAGLIPFEIAISLKIADLTDYSVELNQTVRFGTSIFLFLMNKQSYNSLPQSLQKIIDNNSGRDFAIAMGKEWDQVENVGKNIARKKGKSVVSLSRATSLEFQQLNQRVAKRWKAEVSKHNIDANKLLKAASKNVKKHTI